MKYFVLCGDIREVVEANDPQGAAVQALHQHSDRTKASGVKFRLGEFISVSPTDFDADDAVYRSLDQMAPAAGIRLEPATPKPEQREAGI